MTAVAAEHGGQVGFEPALDSKLIEGLSEEEVVALLAARFRYFSDVGLGWREALACAVGLAPAGVPTR